MKKAMKKLMAALLAVAMVCAMAIPAFAAGEDATAGATTGEGKITIDNVVTGHTYTIYRILNLEYHADTKAYRYTANSDWADFVEAQREYLVVDAKTKAVTWAESKNKTTDIQDFANAAGSYAKTKSVPAVNSIEASETWRYSTSITFENLPLGWYLVVSDLNNGAICSIDTTDPNVTIKEKNGEPTIEKYVDNDKSNNAGIGDTVNFQIDVAVLDGQPKNYVIHDAMSAGLNFNNDVVVYRTRATDAGSSGTGIPLDTLIKGKDYTVEKPTTCTASTKITGCTFEIKFKDDALKANDIITVQYTATVNANAVIGVEGNPNEAILEYNNKYTAPSTTKTYVWEMGVHKFANLGTNDPNHALANAEFQLYKDIVDKNGTTTMYAIFSDATNSEDGTSVYNLTGWTADATRATTVVTPASGNIKFVGLDAGTYYLKETKAPTGYNTLPAPITVEISSTLPTAKVPSTTVTYTVKCDGHEADGHIIPVENKSGTVLPSTGGIGTTIFYVVGGGLMVAAAILLITKKRMENR
jgi:fimbrial isopeptide formation D2 family protein/LPXTG-motif cell wall-anchored protein